MSTVIMAACWPLQGMSPAQKSVLISLADQANDQGVCWPSVQTLALRTCLSERAVQDALAWLQQAGAVYRTYRANTSTSYTITTGNFDAGKAPRASRRTIARGADAAPGANAAPGADAAPRGANAAPGGADAAPLGVQMPHPNHQGNHHLTVTEPGERARAHATTIPDCPDDVDPQTWADWLKLRSGKRAAVTPTVIDRARTEADKARMSLDAFLREWCLRGSQGLKAEWIKPAGGERDQPLTHAQRDALDRRKHWEAMTGQRWPEPDQPPPGDAIEVIELVPQEPRHVARH